MMSRFFDSQRKPGNSQPLRRTGFIFIFFLSCFFSRTAIAGTIDFNRDHRELHESAIAGSTEVFREFIQAGWTGKDFNFVVDSQSLLQRAITAKNIELVKLLLRLEGLDPNLNSEGFHGRIFRLLELGGVEGVKLLVSDPRYRVHTEKVKFPAELSAALMGDLELVKIMFS